MKSLALIELEKHNEVLRAYLLTLLKTNYKILCLTNTFNQQQLSDLQDHPNVEFVSIEHDETFSSFFSRNNAMLTKCEAAIVTTIPMRNPFFGGYKLPCKSIFVVHKYHSYFEPYAHVDWSVGRQGLVDIAKLIRGKIKGFQVRYLSAIAQFDAIVMPSKHSYKYAQERNKHKVPLIGAMDFAINEFCVEPHENELTRIIVPGTINSKSRDYQLLVAALESITNRLEKKVHISLLGKPKGNYGEQIVRQLQFLESPKMTFSFTRDFMDQKDFDKEMNRCDFLILPIKKYMKFDVFLERNGHSCVSGNTNDMVKYGLPSLVPEYYPLDDNLEEIVERYKDGESLGTKILEWINSQKYNRLKKVSREALRVNRAESKKDSFLDIIEKLW